ncbi:hypothetical protein KCP70_06515 [Salmonella enterica subsp. enterica]|nr:hypothetical protein KCP70_06515 [Salmonella enterica subsp. enterica]
MTSRYGNSIGRCTGCRTSTRRHLCDNEREFVAVTGRRDKIIHGLGKPVTGIPDGAILVSCALLT